MTQFDDKYTKERWGEIRRGEEESLIKQLANRYGFQYISLPGITINPQALTLISEDKARAGQIVAFEKQNKQVSVAFKNPNLTETQSVIATLKSEGYQLNLFMCSTLSLEHAWDRYQDQKKSTAVRKGVLDIDPDAIDNLVKKFRTLKDVSDHILNIRTINSARRISETLEAIFAGAVALGASDVHIEPESAGIRLRYRLDGVLHDVIDLQKNLCDRLVSRLKLLSGMVLNEVEEAQDGRFTFFLHERQVEVRSSAIPGAAGESIVMRLLDPSVASFKFENLGLNKIITKIIEEELQKPNGLIVTTGPTGSGKTTALYAFLQEVHTPERKIITIEDPVEYKLDNIVQTQVEDEYTFSSGLRAILRQDPDVIMVGEIRDREVAETAMHAAQTGHLVFSTLHTNSAAASFPRLIDLGADYRAFGTAINLILGQRLVRTLCTNCKKKRLATPDELSQIKSILSGHPAPPSITDEVEIYDSVGCENCNYTGFVGRQGIYEAIKMDDAVDKVVSSDPREHMILEASRPQGIPTMVEDGIEKVLAGITSLTELNRVVDMDNIRGAKKTNETVKDDFSSHIV
ncbi:hypothetical protein CL653_01165 [bacterium]|nr:hypothetical protein [bacterium]